MTHITRVAFLVGQVSARVSKRHGINRADARLLMAIRGNLGDAPLRPSMLSEWLDLTRATITYRMDRLLALGLAESISDASDGRALNVRLTDAGRKVIDEIMTEITGAFADKLAGVDPGVRDALNDGLAALVGHWEAGEGEG